MLNLNLSVLLVDDEAVARRLISSRLDAIPEVHIAASLPNGAAARAYLLEHVVDLVLTDIRMPCMDGLELASFVHQFDPDCPVAVISGYDEFDYARRAMQYGVRDYLLKPVRLKTLAELMEKSRAELRRRREDFSVQQSSDDLPIEQQLARAWTGIQPSELLLSALSDRMKGPGAIFRIAAEASSGIAPELTSTLKNLLRSVLPGQSVFAAATAQHGAYFLIFPNRTEPVRPAEAATEYLSAVLPDSVQWEKVCAVSTPQEAAVQSFFRPEKEGDEALMRAACSYISAHLGDPISREEVARRVCLAPSYFSHMFKERVGQGFSEYLTDQRMKRARCLLATPMPVQDIARTVGFNDRKYFSDVFFKRTGYTPSDYRRRLASGQLSPECEETDA